MRVLELGAGQARMAEQIWPEAEVIRVDLNPAAGADVVADVRALPEDLGRFHAVLASHVLEHLGRTEVLPAVRHWAEFLVAGGELHVVVPDLAWGAEQILRGSVAVQVLMHIFGGQVHELDYHRFGFTVLLLRDLLQSAGLRVQRLQTGPYGIVWPPGTDEVVRARQIYALAVKVEE